MIPACWTYLPGLYPRLGHIKTMVVCSDDKLDEISMTGISHAKLVEGDSITDLTINPEDYGFDLCSLADLKGGDARENAQIALEIFAGTKGPKSDCIVFNSGIALHLSGKTDTIDSGIEIARSVQESGKALGIYRKTTRGKVSMTFSDIIAETHQRVAKDKQNFPLELIQNELLVENQAG